MDCKVGQKLKHVAYDGGIVMVLGKEADGRFLIQRPSGRKSRVSEKTLDAEYSANLDAPTRSRR